MSLKVVASAVGLATYGASNNPNNLVPFNPLKAGVKKDIYHYMPQDLDPAFLALNKKIILPLITPRSANDKPLKVGIRNQSGVTAATAEIWVWDYALNAWIRSQDNATKTFTFSGVETRFWEIIRIGNAPVIIAFTSITGAPQTCDVLVASEDALVA